MMRGDVLQVIYQTIERINVLRAPEERLACTEETPLYGPEGGLDSLGLVSLILDVEAAINLRTDGQLVLADERAMARSRSPFRDVRSLADYILTRLEESPA